MVCIVSGLPCAGLSLVMKMLQAGGMPIVTDPVEGAGDKFEYLARFPDLLDQCRGKAVMLYSMYLCKLPPGPAYQVLYLHRDLQEIADASHALAEKNSRKALLGLSQKAYLLGAHCERVKEWFLGRADIKFFSLNYHDIMAEPYILSLKMRNFLDRELDVDGMSEIIRPLSGSLNRGGRETVTIPA